jgi:hypothetical protein
MNKDSLVLPLRWKAGCWALFASGLVYSYILKNVASGIGWLIQEIDILPPVAGAILGVVAVILLAPLVTAAVIHLFTDWREAVARAAAFWMKGFKISVISLLLILPFLLGGPISRRLKEMDVIEPGLVGRWLFVLVMLASVLLYPFWAWAVLRRLPQTFLGKGLFDPSDLDRLEQEPDQESTPLG